MLAVSWLTVLTDASRESLGVSLVLPASLSVSATPKGIKCVILYFNTLGGQFTFNTLISAALAIGLETK